MSCMTSFFPAREHPFQASRRQDDDGGGGDLRRLLASLSHLLHCGQRQPGDKLLPLHTGKIT